MPAQAQFLDREPSQKAKGAALTRGTAAFHRLRLLLSEHLGGWVVGTSRLQVLAADRQGLRAVAVGEETEVADLDEAGRQNVEQEAANEFQRFQGHHLPALAIFGVALLEADMAVRQTTQPAIGDGDAVGITSPIFKHVLGTAEGRHGIDDPLLLAELVEQSTKAHRVSERRHLPVELKLAFRPSRFQKGEQLASEQAAEDVDGEEEFPPARDPARPVRGQAAGGNQAMQVGVKEQVLAPGVKHGEEADAGSQMSGIGRNLQQRLGHGAKQQSVKAALILQRQGGQVLWAR